MAFYGDDSVVVYLLIALMMPVYCVYGIVFCSLLCGILLNVLSSLESILPRKREFVAFTLVCVAVSLPHGAVGWSVVCDCGISWSYSLTVAPL